MHNALKNANTTSVMTIISRFDGGINIELLCCKILFNHVFDFSAKRLLKRP